MVTQVSFYKFVGPLGKSSIFSFAGDEKFKVLLTTKPKKFNFYSGRASLQYLKDTNLIHDGETPMIFKLSAKNFDADFSFI